MRKTRFLAFVAMLGFAVLSLAQNPPSANTLMSKAKSEAKSVVWDNFSLKTVKKKAVWVVFHASW